MPNFTDPTELHLSDDGFQLKFSGKATFEVLLRGAIDWAKGSLGAGTMPALLKTVTLKSNEERDAYRLVTKSLMRAFRDQIRAELDQAQIDEQENIVIQNKQLDLTSFELLDNNAYNFSLQHFQRPDQLPLLIDFSTAYHHWLKDSFGMSENRARGLAAEFKYYFGYAFYEEVRSGVYSALKAWKNDEFLAEQKSLVNRQRYEAKLRALYYGQSLGQQDVCLADVYIEPDFLVLDKMLAPGIQKELRDDSKNNEDKHFLKTKFPSSIHDYFTQHFLLQKKSEFLACEQEESRMMILLGQPGHGKSSFCYRTAHDLLSGIHFTGSVHLVRLRETRKQVIRSPQEEFIRLLEHEGLTPLNDWKNTQVPSLLLLDGLDELCMSQSLSDADIRELIQECKRLVEDYPNLFIVLTSRFNYLPSDRFHQSQVLVVSLAPLNETQQKQLIQNYADSKKEDINIDHVFLQKINQGEHLRHLQELIELPILLQMILISKIDLKAANSRSAIYSELFTQVLNRKWDKEGRLEKYLDNHYFKSDDLREYLSFLAFKIYQSPRDYLNRTEINSFPETKAFKREFLSNSDNDQGIDSVLKDVLTSFYLKERRKDQDDNQEEEYRQHYAIEFLHKSLYEYLCCEYLWRTIKSIFLKPDGRPQFYEFAEVGEKVQRLFAHTRLSEEMMEYLSEIIELDHDYHSTLQQALFHTLPDLLSYGCIYQYPLAGDSIPQRFTPSQQAIHVFHCFWTIYGQLNRNSIDIEQYFSTLESTLSLAGLSVKDKLTEELPAYTTDVEQYISTLESRLSPASLSVKDKPTEEPPTYAEVLEDIRADIRDNFLAEKKVLPDHIVNSVIQWLAVINIEKMPLGLRFFLFDFSEQKLAGTNFIFNDLACANFSNTDLKEANFNVANLLGANFENADLRNASFRSAELKYANFSDTNLIGTDFTHATLDYACFSRSIFIRSIFEYTKFRKIYPFSHVEKLPVEFIEAKLDHSTFAGLDLSGANFSKASLTQSSFKAATLKNTSFYRAGLFGVNFSGANLEGANFSGARLMAADLTNANLTGVNFYNADLGGEEWYDNKGDLEFRITGAQLTGAVLSDASQLQNLLPSCQEEINSSYIISDQMEEFEINGELVKGYQVKSRY